MDNLRMNILRLLTLSVLCAVAIGLLPAVLADNVTTNVTVQNEPPVASSALINGGSAITLTANTTTEINATVTITDANGCNDVTNVQGLLYRTSVGSGASDDNQNHYTVASCTNNSDCSGGSDTTVSFTCSFDLYWYADPTDLSSPYSADDWEFEVTPSDSESTGTADTDNEEVNTLAAVSLLDSSMSFGELGLGNDTADTNQETRLQNHGNVNLDVNIHSYGSTDGDGFAMVCSVGTIAASYMEYDSNIFSYGAGTSMTGGATLLNMDMAQGSEIDPRPEGTIYYGFGLPASGIQGVCTGVVVLTAVANP